jgi:putative hydrolase of the HAD superfamily
VSDAAAILVDLDGVLRLWDESVTPTIELAAGLAEGIIERVAFAPGRLRAVTTGAASKQSWLSDVAASVGVEYAVRRWAERATWIEPGVLELLWRLADVVPAVLATNGTDELGQELKSMGVDDEFAALFTQTFNSAEMGVAKPDPEFYRHVLRVLDACPESVLYVDDREENVAVACSLGIRCHHYRSLAEFADWCERIGVL